MHIGVIGGGAAGFFGAIAAAEACPHAQVTLLEAGREVLTKVLISGGGRCNVTHACFDPALLVQHYPRGGKALRGAFTRFQPQDTVRWFESRGVKLKTEADGRMFPVTDDSQTIADCLLQAARKAGVNLQTQAGVTALNHDPQTRTFQVQSKRGQMECDRILLATGSSPQGWRLAAQLGHRIIPPAPSLFTFKVTDLRLQDLAGIAVDPVQLHLRVADAKPLTQTGPLLITHWGLSGPAVLKLSAWGARLLHDAKYQATLSVNWVPTLPDLRQTLLAAKEESPRRAIAKQPPVPVPQRLWQRLTMAAQITPDKQWSHLSKTDLGQLMAQLTQSTYTITGKGVFKEEFVTCGGVALKEVNFKTMESRVCPGLYLAGEILDIDGITGGFNFQSAWTTSWLAGQAMATKSHA
nr:NAD(P)/FAD-dependent oxidoreductase [Petrachloros mirabilis]